MQSIDTWNLSVYSSFLVGSFRHKGLKRLFENKSTRLVNPQYAGKCERILNALDFATNIQQMDLPGLKLHKLSGKPERWSVSVTGNYRITFQWIGEKALAMDIDLEDYH